MNRAGRQIRPAQLVVDGRRYDLHSNGRVYRNDGRGIRRVTDQGTIQRVYGAYADEAARRERNRERFG